MATNQEVTNALYAKLLELLGQDTSGLQQSLYKTAEGDIAKQEALDTEAMKNEMAQRGILDSGVWLESLGKLKSDYGGLYEKASSEATTNAFTQYLNALGIANSLGSTISGTNSNESQMQAYLQNMKNQEDASLWGGIGSLLGSEGIGSGLMDLISSGVTGLSSTIKKLLGDPSTTTTLPTTYAKTSASNPITSSGNWAKGNVYVAPKIYSGTQYSQQTGQKSY
jgi:hypothetical protein